MLTCMKQPPPDAELRTITHYFLENSKPPFFRSSDASDGLAKSERDVTDTKGLPLVRRLVSNKISADEQDSTREREENSAVGMSEGNEEAGAMGSTKETGGYFVGSRGFALNFVPGGVDDFPESNCGNRKVRTDRCQSCAVKVGMNAAC